MDMKCLVIVVALVVHQVVGQGSTELVTKASNEFANQLYKAVGEQPGNVLVCPVSLHVALALLHQAAGGTTATQMEQVLRLPASNTAKANIRDSYKALLSGIKDNVLKIATKMYPAEGFKLNNDYVTVAREYFLSDVESINYNNPANAANKINKYVEEKTNDKIHNLISPDSISGLTRLIIINAVHFQATWKTPFNPAYTDYFKISPTQRVQTQMMTQTDFFDYKEDEHLDAKVLKMDYNTGGYSMVFILPNKEDGLHALEGKLATMPLAETLSGMKETKVEVSIPKFKMEQKIDLKERLIQMGLTEIFEPRADLRGLANENNLYVSDVIQKTYINVHENGTEAAAATGIQAVATSAIVWYPPLPVFRADRPFFFALKDGSDTIIFNGRFTEPIPV